MGCTEMLSEGIGLEVQEGRLRDHSLNRHGSNIVK